MRFRESLAVKAISAFLAFTSFSMWTAPVYADNLPAGYEAVAGSTSYEVSPDGMTGTLTASDAATIGQWNQGFNIAGGYTFNALLPANGVHLSRDISANPSEIFGALNVPQGRFFLVNTSGIYFGPTAQVNAAGLVASTLDINNDDFLAGRYHFNQVLDPASVINDGTINIGSEGGALLGGAVSNRGLIAAKESTLALASGSEATLSFDNSGLISVVVDEGVSSAAKDENGQTMTDAVSNKGIVKAEGGKVVMTAEAANDIFDSLVNNEGIIEAESMGSKGGEILLSSKKSSGIVKNSGTLSATGNDAGEKGGKIVMEGEKVGLLDGAVVDVSGDLGGGSVNIGGGYQGGDSSIRNATVAVVDKNTSIKADAVSTGDGGQVVVWANGTTRFYGDISSKGGAFAGNGGTVEVSGKEYLEFDGYVNTMALYGAYGTLLLDPKFLIVANAGGAAYNGGVNNLFANNVGGTTTITATSINSQSSNVSLQANTDVTFTDAVNIANNNTDLTVRAGRDILVNANITTNSGKINFTANDSGATGADRDAGTGDIIMAAGTTINSGGDTQTYTIGSSTTAPFSPGSITLANLTASGSTITITGAGAANTVTQLGSTSITASTLSLNGTSNYTLTNSTNSVSTLSANVTGDVSYRDTNDLATNSLATNGGSLNVQSGNDLDINAAITTGVGNVTLSAANDIDLTGAGSDVTTTGSFTANADNDASGAGSFISSNSNSAISAASASITANNYSTSGTINTGAGNVTLKSSTAGNVIGVGTTSGTTMDISDSELDSITTTGTINIGDATNTGGIIIADAEALTQGAKNFQFNTAGTVTVDSGNTFTTTGNVTVVSNDIAINNTLSANNVTLRADTNTDTIGVGNAGTFNLTDAELDNVVATGTVTIGDTSNTGGIGIGGTGALTQGAKNFQFNTGGTLTTSTNAFTTTGNVGVDANAISLGSDLNATTVTLDSNTGATQTGGKIAATNLLLLGAGNFSLASATNAISTLAANIAGALTYKDSNALSIGSVSGTNGVTTGNNAIDISTVNGTLTVTNTGATNDVDSGTAATTLTAGSSANDNALTINASANVNATGGATLVADNMALTGTVNAGSNTATLRQFENGTLVKLGGADAAGTLGLTPTELNNITAGTIKVGDANSGALSIEAAINPANATTLSLESGGTITQTVGSTITETNLALRGTSVTLNEANDAGTVAATATTGAVSYKDTNAVTIGTVDGLSGVSTTNQNVTLNSGNTMTVSQNISAGNGTVDLNTTAGGVNQTAGTLTADKLKLSGVGNVTLNSASNDVTTLAVSKSSGDLSLTDADDLAIGTVGATNGITAISGAVTLNAGSITSSQNVSSGSFAATASTIGLKDVTTTAGAITTTGATTLGTGNNLNSATSVTVNGALNLGATGTNTITSGSDSNVSVTGTTTGTGAALTVNSQKDATLSNVNIGSGALSVNSDTDSDNLAAIQTGSITAGTASLTGTANDTINVTGAVNASSLTASGATSITFGSNVTTNAAQNFTANTIFTGGTHTVNTSGQGITMTGDLTLNGTTALNTNNGNVNVTGVIYGTDTLTSNAGTGTVTFGSDATVGSTNLTGSSVSLKSVTTTAGAITTNGPTTLGNGSNLNSATSVNVNGTLNLGAAGTNTLTSGSDSNVSTGAINGSGAHLQIDSQKDITTGNVNTSTGSFTANADTDNDNAAALSTGTLTAGTATLSGTGANDTISVDTVNANSLSSTGASILTFLGNVVTNLAQSFTATTIQTNGTHTVNTSGEGISLSGNVDLQNATALNTNNGAINVTGVVNGAETLSANAGTSTVTLQNAAGGTTALTSVDLTGSTVDVKSVKTTGSQTYNGDTILDGTYQSATAGSITINGNATLDGGTMLQTAGAATDDITITGEVDGAAGTENLQFIAGLGDVLLQGAVGAGNGIGQLLVTSAGSFTASDAINAGSTDVSATTISLKDVTTDGNQEYTGTTTLGGDLETLNAGADITITGDTTIADLDANSATVDTVSVTTNAGDVTFDGKVDGTQAEKQSLTVDTANVEFTDSIGQTTKLNTLTINNSGTFTVAGDVDTVNASIANLTLGEDSEIELDGTFSVGNLDTDGWDLSIIADEIDFTGTVVGGGNLILTAVNAATKIVIGAAEAVGTLDLSTMDLAALAGGLFDSITFGSATHAGGIDINTATFADTAVTFLSPAAGAIQILGELLGTGTASFSFTGSGATTHLFDDILTEGGLVSIDDNVVVENNVSIDTTNLGTVTTGGNITVTGTIEDDGTGNDLALQAGTNGAIDLQDTVGATDELNSLTATGATISVKDVTTTGTQTYTGATTLDGTYSGSGVDVNGAATLAGATDITATAGDIDFSSTIDGDTNSLTANASGAVNVGDAASDLSSVDLTGATVSVKDVTTTGTQTYTGAITLDGTYSASAFDVNGATTLAGATDVTTTAGNADFSSTVTGAQDFTVNAGTGSVDIHDNVDTASVDLTGSTITLHDVTTTGTQTYTGDVTTNSAYTSTGAGAITFDGDVTLGDDTTVTTAGGAGDDITFTGLIDGAKNLILDAGLAGNVYLQDLAGSVAPLASLTVTAAEAFIKGVKTTGNQLYTALTTLAGDIIATDIGSSITFDGDVVIDNIDTINAVDADAVDVTTNNGAITFNGEVDGTDAYEQKLEVSSGSGQITFNGNVGQTVPLHTLTIASSTAPVEPALYDVLNYDVITSVTLNLVGDLIYNVGTGLAEIFSINTNGFNLTIIADEIDFIGGAGSVLGGGTLILQAFSEATTKIVLGAGEAIGTLDLSITDLAAIADGFTQLVFGSGNQAAGIDVHSVTLLDAVALLSPVGGAINILGDLIVDGQVDIVGSGSTTHLFADIITLGADIFINDNVVLEADVTLDTTNSADPLYLTGANVQITATTETDGTARDLTINAGTAGNSTLTGTVGAANNLDSLSVTGATSSFANTVRANNVSSTAATTSFANNVTALTDDVTVTGDLSLTGNSVVTTGGGAGDDFTVTGTTNGAKDLSVSAGAGSVDLQGIVGGSTALTSLTVNNAGVARFGDNVTTTGAQAVTAGTIRTNGTHTTTTAGSAISFSGNLDLQDDTALNTNNGNVTVSGTIDGAKALSASAGTANVDLQGNVGSTTPLTSLTVNSATLARFGGNVTTTGAQAVTAGTIRTNGTHSTTASNITLSGNVDLQNNTNLNSTGGNVTVSGTVNGAKDLSITAGAGNVDLQSSVGSGAALSALTVNSAATARFGSSVTTTGNQDITAGTIQTNSTHATTTAGSFIDLGGNVTLQNDTNLNTNNGNVTISGTIDGPKALTIAAGTGAVVIGGAMGGSSALASVVATGATIGLKAVKTTGLQTYNGATTLDGAYQSTAAGSITFNGAVNLAGDTNVMTAGAATDDITVNGTVDGAKTLSLSAGLGDILLQFALGATTALTSVSATGSTIDLKSVKTVAGQSYSGATTLNGTYESTTAGNITVGGPATLAGDSTLTTANGTVSFASTVNGAKNLNVAATTGDALFLGGVGQSTALTSVNASGLNVNLKSVKTTGAQTYTGVTTLDGAYQSTSGGAISFNGSANLAGDTTVQTAGLLASDDITFTGTVNGAKNLILNAGAGDITLALAVGGGTPLLSLLATAANIVLNAVTTTGTQTYNGKTTLGGDLSTTNSNVLINGNTVLADTASDLVVISTGTGDVTLNGKLDGTTVDTVTGNQSLTINANDIAINDSIGSSVKVNALTLNNSGSVSLPALVNVASLVLANLILSGDLSLNLGTGTFGVTNVNTNGFNLTLTADEINFLGAAGTVAGGGNLILQPFTTSLKVVVAGAADFASQLDLTVSDILALANGFTSIQIGRTNGTGGMDINTVTFLDPISLLSPMGGAINVMGTLSGSGDASILIDGFNATTHLFADIITAGMDIFISDNVVLEADVTLNSAGGDITVTGTTESDGTARDLTLTAGAGTATLTGTVGAASNLDQLNVSSASAATFGNTVRANNVASSATNTTFSNNVTALTDDVTVAGNLVLAGNSTVTTGGAAGDDFSVTGTVTGPANLAVNAALGNSIFGNTVSVNSLSSTAATTRFNNNVTALTDDVAVTGNLVVAGDLAVTTGGGAGDDFTVTGTTETDGTARDLSIAAGLGASTMTGTVGAANNFDQLTVTSAGQAAFGNTVRANNVTSNATNTTINNNVTALTDDVTINGNLTVAANSVVTTGSAAGDDFTVTGTTNGPGSLTVAAGSGSSDLQDNAGSTTALGALTVNAATARFGGDVTSVGSQAVTASAIQTNGTHTTTGAGNTITLTGPVTLQADSGFVTNNGNITLTSTLNGPFEALFNAGTLGDVSIADHIGSVQALGRLLIQSARDFILALNKNITAGSISQQAGTGLTSFTGDIHTTDAAGINLVGHNFLLGDVADGSDTIVTDNGGDLCVTCDGTGNFTLNADVSGVTGAFCVFGGGVFNLNVDIVNFNGITIDADVILGGLGTSRTLNAGTDVITFGSLSSVSAGSYDLNLIADEIDLFGAADSIFSDGDETLTLMPYTQGQDLTIGGANGTSALDLTVTEVATFNDTTLGNDNWGSVLIGNPNGSGNITINAITFSDPTTIRTPQAPGSLYVNGQITGFDDGSITLDGSGNTLYLAANIITMGAAIHLMDAVVLMTDVLLDTTAGGNTAGANIQIDGAVNGNLFGEDDLTMNAGTGGNILLGSPVGLGNRIGALIVQNANNWTAAELRARSIRQLDGQGTTLFQGALNTDGPAGINLVGNNFNLNVSSSVTTTQGGGFTADHDGLLDISSSAGMNLDGAFLEQSTAGTGLVQLGADITTTNDDITFNRATTLSDHVVLNSAGGDIALNGTVDATTAGDQNLTLIAGTGNPLDGDITTAVIGGSTRVGVFTAQNAVDFTNAGVTAAEVNVSNIGGTATFNGVINTNTVNGIEIDGNNVTLNGATTSTNGGDMIVTNDGDLTIADAATINLDGEFRQVNGSLASTASVGGNITTSASNDISFQAPVTLTGADAVLLNSGRDIRFFNTVNGGSDLTMTAARDIFMDAAAGQLARLGDLIVTTVRNWTSNGITAASIEQQIGTGTTTFGGALDTDTAAGIDLTGNIFNVNQAVTTTGAGAFQVTNAGALNIAAAGDMNLDGQFFQLGAGQVNTAGDITTSAADVLFMGPVNLTGNVAIATGGNGITFNNTLDGGFGLTLDAGATGNIAMNQAVGAGTRLGALVVMSVADWTAASSITAASIDQQAGTGTTTFSGALNTNTAAGIDLDGNVFNVNAPVTTTNAGTFTVTNAGALNIAAAGDMNLDGAFLQDGAGQVNTAGDITTTADNITFNGQVNLTGPVSMASNNGIITFNNTVDGSQDLTLNSGTGATNFNAAVGSIAAVGDGTGAAITMNSTGMTTFNGTLRTNSGLTAAGPVTFRENVDLLDGDTATTLNGDVVLDGLNINSADAISFGDSSADQTTLSGGPVSIDTTTGAVDANITFNSRLDGAQDLTLTAGTANILMNAAVGAGTRLGDLVVMSVADWTAASSITAASIDQQAGTGTTTFGGALNTNTAAGIDLDGNVFNVNAPVTTTNAGTFTVTNAGALNIAAAGDMNLDGAFLQDGAGQVNTAGDITTTADNIEFQAPVQLTGNVAMDSNGGDIRFMNTVNGVFDLTLAADAGNILMDAAVGAILGQRLAALLVQTVNNWDANESIFAQSITQLAGTGTSTFLGNVDTSGAAGIDLTGNNFFFGAAGSVNATNGGDIDVDAGLNGTSRVDLNGPVTTDSGDINIQANDDVLMAAAADVTTVSGDVLIRADQDGSGSGQLSMAYGPADQTVVNSGSGKTTLRSGESLLLGRVVTTNASDDAVTLRSSHGSVLDGGENVALDVDASAGGLIASAATGIGNGVNGALETNVRRVNATTASGDIQLDVTSTQPLTIANASVTTGTGNILINQFGSFPMTIEGASTANGTITFNSIVDLLVTGNITAGGLLAGIALTADSDGNLTGDLTIASGATVNSGVGPLTLNGVQVAVLGSAISGGFLNINAGGSLLLNIIAATSFVLDVHSDIIDMNGDANNITADTTSIMRAGGIIGQPGNPLDVHIKQGNLEVSAGSQFNGVSINLAGIINGTILTSLTPGLVIFNNIAFAGDTIEELNSDLASLFNIIAQGPIRDNFSDLDTIDGLQAGFGLSPQFEKPLVPQINLSALDRMVRVLVNTEEEKKWLGRRRPTVTPTPIPTVEKLPVVEPTILPRPTPAPVPTVAPVVELPKPQPTPSPILVPTGEQLPQVQPAPVPAPVLTQQAATQTPQAPKNQLPLVPPVTPFPPDRASLQQQPLQPPTGGARLFQQQIEEEARSSDDQTKN